MALPSDDSNPLDINVFYGRFNDAYTKLVNEEPLVCAHRGVTLDALCHPDAAILDVRITAEILAQNADVVVETDFCIFRDELHTQNRPPED